MQHDQSLTKPHSDATPTLASALPTFVSRHPSPQPPTASDLLAIRSLASLIIRRSAAIVAASVFALWELKNEAEDTYLRSLDGNPLFAANARAEMDLPRAVVAYNGSVIERYPDYLTSCQGYIDELVAGKGAVDLVPAKESSLLGAAVALACLEEGGAN